MNKNSKNSYKDIDEFFLVKPTPNQKAWSIIHEFYHIVLSHMEKNNISKADLARKLGKSRASITQMFNKTPNITVKKMIEIADAIGIDLKISTTEANKNIEAPRNSTSNKNVRESRKLHKEKIWN
jgi:transcriptional regulator with XRE-family HTH domain